MASAPSAKLQYFPMNTKLAPTDDINVRRAIAYAFDYTSALRDILGGANPAAGFVPTVVPRSCRRRHTPDTGC